MMSATMLIVEDDEILRSLTAERPTIQWKEISLDRFVLNEPTFISSRRREIDQAHCYVEGCWC